MKRSYVIGVVRDPVDRIVSAWRRKHYSTPFGVWLRGQAEFYVGGVDFLRTPQVTWLKYADRVLDHAHLDDEWGQLCVDMGWDNTPLPRSNKAVEEQPVVSYNDRELIMDRFLPDYQRWRFT